MKTYQESFLHSVAMVLGDFFCGVLAAGLMFLAVVAVFGMGYGFAKALSYVY